MSDSLRLHRSIHSRLARFLPKEDPRHLDTLACSITGLFRAKKIFLSEIAAHSPSSTQLTSRTMRLHRFLKSDGVEPERLYRPVIEALMHTFRDAPIRLILDTTKVGFEAAIASLSMAYRRRALPLIWSAHPNKRTAISMQEATQLIERAARYLPEGASVEVTADSAFARPAFLKALLARHWDFVVRGRRRYKVRLLDAAAPQACPVDEKGQLTLGALARDLSPGEYRAYGRVAFTQKWQLEGVFVSVYWMRGQKRPWILLHSGMAYPERAYRRRMWTEELYADVKEGGFGLERTHVRALDRLERLMLIVSWVYVWLIALAARVVRSGRRYLVDRTDRRDLSYFQIGKRWLEDVLNQDRPIRFLVHFSL